MFFFNLYSADFIQADIAATADDILRDISDLSSKGSAALIMFFFKPSHSDGDSIITGSADSISALSITKEEILLQEFSEVSAANVLLFFIIAFLIVSALVGVN